MDIANLVIAVDSTQAGTAAGTLDRLTQAGQRAQTAAGGLGRATTTAGEAVRRFTAEELRAAQAIERFAVAAGRMNASSRAIVQSAGQMRAGMQQLSFQVGDVAQQFALGVRPMTIFAQQAGQVIQALQMMGGQSSALLRFLGGPWGMAMTAAGIVLAPLIGRLLDTRTALERATDELRNNAREAEATRQAQEAFGRTLPGIEAAIRSETRALEDQNRSLQQNQMLQLEVARFRQADLQRLQRENVAAQAVQLRSIERLEGLGGGNTGLLAAAHAELTRLRAENARIQGLASGAAEGIRAAQIPIVRREAEALADPLAAIRDRFQAMRDAAEAARPPIERLRQELANINRQERAAVAAQQASARSSGGGTLVRPVTGGVLSQFGASRAGVPINGRLVAGRSHQGVDLRGNIGDPVVAPEGGTAYVRNAPGGLGLYVEIRADSGARDLLAHLSGARVQSGQRVEAGQLVGLVGTSGNARGGTPHLHWQRQAGGRWADPMRSVGSSGAAQAAMQAQAELERAAQARQRAEEQAARRLAEEIERLTRGKVEAAQGALEVSQADLQTQQEIARLQGEFAGTAAERRASQLRLLEISEQMERAELAALRNSSDPAVRARAEAREAAIPQIYGLRRAGIDRDAEGPMARYMREMRATSADMAREIEGVQVRAFDSLADAIAGVVSGTQSLSEAFSNMARGIVSDIIQMTIRMLIFRAISSVFGGGFGGGVGASLSGIGAGLGAGLPGRATGGPVNAGGGYIVGERGPELFRPNTSGTIIPNNRLAANSNGPVEVHVTVTASPELDVRIEAVSARTVADAAPVIVNAAVGNMARMASRPALMGRR